MLRVQRSSWVLRYMAANTKRVVANGAGHLKIELIENLGSHGTLACRAVTLLLEVGYYLVAAVRASYDASEADSTEVPIVIVVLGVVCFVQEHLVVVADECESEYLRFGLSGFRTGIVELPALLIVKPYTVLMVAAVL